MTVPYQIIRTDRKTVAIQIMPDGKVVVRCPKRMNEEAVIRFVESKSAWIGKHIESIDHQDADKLTASEIEQLREQTRQLVTDRIRHYAPMIGVTYGQISIRAQRSRWGSCSSKGNLNFNCLLALVPAEVLDYVVVHELCHRLEMNHSQDFWSQVERVLPNYKTSRKWLKENGRKLIARL